MSETWGKGAKNTIGWGSAACTATNNWGKSQKDSSVAQSWSGDTDISGCSGGGSGLAQINNVYSMNFDGTNDTISLGNSTITGTTYSVSLWFKSTATATQVLCEKIPDEGGQFAYRMYLYTSGNLELLGTQTSGTAYNDGKWHNVVIIQDPSQPNGKTGRGFVDGSLVTEGNSANNTSGSSDFFIGSRSAVALYFNGQIDELAVFNYALTDAEILSIYNATAVGKTADLSQLTTPPVAWYRMGD